MSRNLPRLYVDASLSENGGVSFSRNHARYLKDVMRLREGDHLLVFNGRDGEWRCVLSRIGGKSAQGVAVNRTRAQTAAAGPDLHFAPVKRAGTGFIAEKATELGVRSLRPVITAYTDAARVNAARLRANAVEAAEQCGRMDVPEVHEPVPLMRLADAWPEHKALIVADETGRGTAALEAFQAMDHRVPAPAFVIGPQGGFSETELAFLRGLSFSTTVDLGPRVLRAETAVVAVLACWQAARGDWT